MSEGHRRIDAVHRFVSAVVNAAIDDERDGVDEYRAGRNRGKDLMTRLNLEGYRVKSRNGDSVEARRIYMAARFLYRTETKDLGL